MKLYATWSGQGNPRVSDIVEVVIPAMPQPYDVIASDASLKVRIQGRALYSSGVGNSVKATVGTQSVEGRVKADGRFDLIIPNVPGGTHNYSVVTKGYYDVPDSAAVRGTVTVGSPPNVPLMVIFPEVNRPIGRITKVTGVATPNSSIQASLAEGSTASATANAAGHWQIDKVVSDLAGEVSLRIENLSTDEVEIRPVVVAPFPQWTVTQFTFGNAFNQEGESKRVSLARGTADPYTALEFRRAAQTDYLPLATADEQGAWQYENSNPPFDLIQGPHFVRAIGDDVSRSFTSEQPAPVITSPLDGQQVATTVTFTGFGVQAILTVESDGRQFRSTRVDAKSWRAEVGPLSPGVHTIAGRVMGTEVWEVTRVNLYVDDTEQ
ncbi:hypothetical protein ACQKPE_16470 [Pseudomonas sp. NPDC089554]|uniref:hypothetical protein n=1 Tax=Pseudomonas sp. NPDC089554 TaxID=3390653 RepID=UPI003D049688